MFLKQSLKDFNPHDLAKRERVMLEDYYSKDFIGLFVSFVLFLRTSRKLSFYESGKVAYFGSVAALAFSPYGREAKESTAKYITLFYEEISKHTKEPFDYKHAAHLEYEYWFADRYRREDDELPAQLLAEIASIVFHVPKERLSLYGVRRDEAIHLLDAYRGFELERANWGLFEKKLEESYLELHKALL